MTVSELIKELQQLPADAIVQCHDSLVACDYDDFSIGIEQDEDGRTVVRIS